MDNNKNIDEWVKERTKQRIDKSSARHPIMNLIKTRADEKILQMFEEDNRPRSAFNHKDVQPSKFDHFIFPLINKYNEIKEYLKEKQVWNKTINFINSTNNYIRKQFLFIDNYFEIADIELKMKKVSKQTKKQAKISNEDPIVEYLLEKEKLNSKFQRQLTKIKFGNIMRNILFVKPVHVVTLKKDPVNVPSTIFYKLWRIGRNKMKLSTKFIACGLFVIPFVYFRFISYDQNQMRIKKDSNITQTIPCIFDKNTDKKFELAMNNEAELMYYSIFIKELLDNKEKLQEKYDKMYGKDFLENYISSNNSYYFVREFLPKILSISIPFISLLYLKFYKKQKFKQFYFKIFATYLISVEILEILNYFSFLNYRATLLELMFGRDNKTILKYSFYYNNSKYF